MQVYVPASARANSVISTSPMHSRVRFLILFDHTIGLSSLLHLNVGCGPDTEQMNFTEPPTIAVRLLNCASNCSLFFESRMTKDCSTYGSRLSGREGAFLTPSSRASISYLLIRFGIGVYFTVCEIFFAAMPLCARQVYTPLSLASGWVMINWNTSVPSYVSW